MTDHGDMTGRPLMTQLHALLGEAEHYGAMGPVGQVAFLRRAAVLLHQVVDETGDERARWIARDAERWADQASRRWGGTLTPMTDRWVEVTLYGGPLDGQTITVDVDDPDPGVAMISPHSAYGPTGRSWYEPDASGRWVWQGDSA